MASEEEWAALQKVMAQDLTAAVVAYISVVRWFSRAILAKTEGISDEARAEMEHGGEFAELKWFTERGKQLIALLGHEKERISLSLSAEEQKLARDRLAHRCNVRVDALRQSYSELRREDTLGG